MSAYKSQALQVLRDTFGYQDFRPGQLDIVCSVLEGSDVLALLPTGGGKSICFQVPALAKEGICLVVSPLVALMKDQVDNLKKRGIKAAAIYSGMSKQEIDVTLDNCIYGGYKFLYVSPERLKSDLFLARYQQMKVGLLAIDESHCISQWGYDFRPPYLEIAAIRPLHPGVPCIALTASATLKVREDIIEKLALENPRVFVKSFSRKNLSYSVRHVENKVEKALEILARVPGSAIIYLRNRRGTRDIAEHLQRLGVSATFYHAGLDGEERGRRQEAWKRGDVRVMVSTNAFGMGIDKGDVRVVIHLDLPENLENYYQEAGRAGRDELLAYGVLLVHANDLKTLAERADQTYPEISYIRKVYQSLANYYRIAVGSSLLVHYDFNIQTFSDTYGLEPLQCYHAIRVLQEEGFILMNESFYASPSLRFLVDHGQLYEFQVRHERLDALIKLLLRFYGGELFVDYINFHEERLAAALGVSPKALREQLESLANKGIIDYNPRKDSPQITFLTARYDAGKLPLQAERIRQRRELVREKAQAMIRYCEQEDMCRANFISEYFGEETRVGCGVCDVCLRKKRQVKQEGVAAREALLATLQEGGTLALEELLTKASLTPEPGCYSFCGS
ncbi:ATP-dependent DNA helicase RecQ [Nitritalea halalkaliphila LW7]|uniref:ATP-dependent DNA helicase RecQ n=1 Tax=Nitritalea halalkaliphila LW7 TaxID=1189621 RepID=I5BYB4_9BACT|nr:ATP-dependent DNA helicase RecQ [Nitritalea halalkaliphila]EIM74566.1 ATP-dependent DNA helicase RecQ [Nitritalea halalkaliphila LW7]